MKASIFTALTCIIIVVLHIENVRAKETALDSLKQQYVINNLIIKYIEMNNERKCLKNRSIKLEEWYKWNTPDILKAECSEWM